MKRYVLNRKLFFQILEAQDASKENQPLPNEPQANATPSPVQNSTIPSDPNNPSAQTVPQQNVTVASNTATTPSSVDSSNLSSANSQANLPSTPTSTPNSTTGSNSTPVSPENVTNDKESEKKSEIKINTDLPEVLVSKKEKVFFNDIDNNGFKKILSKSIKNIKSIKELEPKIDTRAYKDFEYKIPFINNDGDKENYEIFIDSNKNELKNKNLLLAQTPVNIDFKDGKEDSIFYFGNIVGKDIKELKNMELSLRTDKEKAISNFKKFLEKEKIVKKENTKSSNQKDDGNNIEGNSQKPESNPNTNTSSVSAQNITSKK